jgi:hypothetical protein
MVRRIVERARSTRQHGIAASGLARYRPAVARSPWSFRPFRPFRSFRP